MRGIFMKSSIFVNRDGSEVISEAYFATLQPTKSELGFAKCQSGSGFAAAQQWSVLLKVD